jgi:diadenosine tetraphosphate (Ap4A) HIT family hydrolase
MKHLDPQGCPFCDRASGEQVIAGNELAAAIPDAYPLADGHTLVVPRRHVIDFFQLSGEEQAAMLDVVRIVQQTLSEEHQPDGFNVGINCGLAAGQTIGHAHLHLIPRFSGDTDDPRGGIRWVIPEKAVYWDSAD